MEAGRYHPFLSCIICRLLFYYFFSVSSRGIFLILRFVHIFGKGTESLYVIPAADILPFFALILSFCRQTAADMTFLLVFFNNFPHLCRQPCMKLRQTDGNILMDGRFADAEDGGGLPDSRFMLCNVGAEAHGTVIKCLRARGGLIILLLLQYASLPKADPDGIRFATPYAADSRKMRTAFCLDEMK